MPGQFFLLTTQHVDTQVAVGAEHVVGGAVAVDAHQHGGWRVGHRAHGAGGDAATTARAVGGDDVHRGRQLRHGVAKVDLLLAQVGHVDAPSFRRTAIWRPVGDGTRLRLRARRNHSDDPHGEVGFPLVD
ncbi:hypothetical protein D3C76_1049690 [compost metagenome]